LAELFQSIFISIRFPLGGFECPNVLAQQRIALPHNPLGLSFAFWMLHHEVKGLLIDISEKRMDGALDVV
jgi:hypothetical protein